MMVGIATPKLYHCNTALVRMWRLIHYLYLVFWNVICFIEWLHHISYRSRLGIVSSFSSLLHFVPVQYYIFMSLYPSTFCRKHNTCEICAYLLSSQLAVCYLLFIIINTTKGEPNAGRLLRRKRRTASQPSPTSLQDTTDAVDGDNKDSLEDSAGIKPR